MTCCVPVEAQVTNWNSLTGGDWTDGTKWDAGVPSSTGDAIIQQEFTSDLTINLTGNTSVSALRFTDTGTTTDNRLIINPNSPSYTLTFAGANPMVESGSSTSGGYGLQINSVVDFDAAGVTKMGGGTVRFNNKMTGGGTLTVSQGTLELVGDSTGFTGDILITGGALQGRAFAGNGANLLGDTAHATTIDGGRFQFRDTNNKTSSEPFIINKIHHLGGVMMYASGNVTINGPVTLNDDGSFSVADWTSSGAGQKRDFHINSVISEAAGGPHSVYFLGEFSSGSAQGANSRLSEMFLGAQSTYGGNTYVTTNKTNDETGSFSGNLRLDINNALPTGTTLVLGGSHAVTTGTLGTSAGNGKLAMGGFNQEVAGLQVNGTGTENRVVGNSATLSTLTLNIADGATNTYDGFLGWTDTDDNNLALVKTGAGTLKLTADNTYTGATTVNGGTLIINGDQSGATGDINVAAGASLGGSGTLGGDVTISGIHQPGNSPGVQTFGAGLDYTGGSSVVWELADNVSGLTIQAGPTYDFDQIVVAGDLTFQGTTTFNLDFNSPDGSLVNWTDTFWDSERSWLVYDVSGTTGGFENLSLSVIDWDDGGAAHLFDSIHPSGSFHLIQQENDIFLSYAPVPEPNTVLVLLGAVTASLFRRSRRKIVGRDDKS